MRIGEDLISRQAAIDALIRKKKPGNNGDGSVTITVMTDNVIKETLESLPSAQPERDGFTTWALSVADSYRVKAIIEKFRDYQVEWLTAHCDLDFCKEDEDAIVRFLRDTADCFEMEVEEYKHDQRRSD